MRSRREWVALLLGVAALSGCDSVEPVVTDAIDADALMRHLEYLADDSLYGREAGSVHEQQAAQYIRDEFESYGLDPGAGDYFQEFSFDGGRQSQNVIGILPGAGSLGSQWVIVGAHYDHLGWNQVTADSIEVFNGADDNASGTAMMLELARYLAHHFTRGEGAGRDRRSLMFHAYGAEEEGLIGSTHFCNNPTLVFGNIAAMVDLDMVGRLRDDILVVNGSAALPAWHSVLQAANAGPLELAFVDDRLLGSDHVCFYRGGRPAIMFFTRLHPEYHTPEDDVWRINLGGMLQIGNLAAGVLQRVTTDPGWPAVP